MSAAELIVVYLRQRARPRVLIPLSILMAFAGRLFVAPMSDAMTTTAIAALRAFGLVLAFRLWDDLQDREEDRVLHPERVSASAQTVAPLYLLGFALSAATIGSLVTSSLPLRRLTVLAVAAAMLSVWYGARSTNRRRHALGEHILAIKYPLIAYAAAPELPAKMLTTRVVVILVALYLLICVYEYADDVELRQVFTSRRFF